MNLLITVQFVEEARSQEYMKTWRLVGEDGSDKWENSAYEGWELIKQESHRLPNIII